MVFHALSADKISEQIETLSRRINERFPVSGLGRVCSELLAISRDTEKRCQWLEKPKILLRIAAGLLVLVILMLLLNTIYNAKLPGVKFTIVELIQVFEASLNAVVLTGAAIIFIVTVENRVKRSKALKAINELRAIAHVIDMHQLTKDPSRVLTSEMQTKSSPQVELSLFQLSRYLNYSSEMLSLTGKVAALYPQVLNDSVVLSAVNELEELTTGLASKIWQKIMILDIYSEKEKC